MSILEHFHWYGFFIGLAVVVVLEIFQKNIKRFYFSKDNFPEKNFWKLVISILFFGIVGGRLWHVMTDWQVGGFSFSNLGKIIATNQGGMSIFGVLLFGLIGLWWGQKKWFAGEAEVEVSLRGLVDALVLGLPLGQAIGRLGNWVNQELYGLPTNMPWGIFIKPENRVVPFLLETKFHPLFAYEALLMLGIFGILYWLVKTKRAEVGEGKLGGIYLISYLVIRFFLDFLRVQKIVLGWGLGLNQFIILLFLFLVVAFYVLRKYFKKPFLVLVIFIFSALLLILGRNKLEVQKQHSWLLSLPDHSIVSFKIKDVWGFDKQELRVEVVNTEESIAKGLSGRQALGEFQEKNMEVDGMLFIFSKKGKPIFWMKDMKFNIDIIWLDGSRVIGVERDILVPNSILIESDLKKYSPMKDVNFVLETNPFFIAFPAQANQVL